MMRSGLTILLLFYSLLSTGQDLFKYTPGISFNVESTYPQATGNKYEYFTTTEVKLLRVIDFLGREVDVKPGVPQLYLYSDGSVVKRVISE